ncbi:MAG: hypothetical protein IT317_05330 [Anaerolineales bacterium]|nr:hypothetical protein [Anaerolineales bacterium]
MTPHNEHIMLKLARAEQSEHARAAAELSRSAWMRPHRKLAAAAGLASALVVAAVLALMLWPF